MKKLKTLMSLSMLVLLLPSCVFSLFPIYTADTLVFLPELVGKWYNDAENGETYVEFLPLQAEKERQSHENNLNNITAFSNSPFLDSAEFVIKGENWSIRSFRPIEMERNGQKYTDTLAIKKFYDSLFNGLSRNRQMEAGNEKSDSASSGMITMLQDLGKMLKQMGKGLQNLGDEARGVDRSTEKFAYMMRQVDEGEVLTYKVYLVNIGKDYFLDIYPNSEDADNGLMINLFPVHTFMKIALDRDKMSITPFDLEKLNELFKSNLIRLRHEYVDGNVLITAQPEEIQKFLLRYSNDETVFNEPDTYSRIVQ
jgi:hypothetical protein